MICCHGWSKVDPFFAGWREAGFRPVGHIVFSKTYASKTKFLRYQHEQAFLLAKGNPIAECGQSTEAISRPRVEFPSLLWVCCRPTGSYPETGFDEIGARAALRKTAFPPSRLRARSNFPVKLSFAFAQFDLVEASETEDPPDHRTRRVTVRYARPFCNSAIKRGTKYVLRTCIAPPKNKTRTYHGATRTLKPMEKAGW